MPKVDGKEYPYTEDGEKAAAAAAKKSGVRSTEEKRAIIRKMMDEHEKRQGEIDRGERTVGKKTGTLPKQSAAELTFLE